MVVKEVKNTRDNGDQTKKISGKDLGLLSSLMEVCIKVRPKMKNIMGRGAWHMSTVISTKVNGKTAKPTDMAFSLIQMVQCTRVNGFKINNMVSAPNPGTIIK
jgi:hypothetical protein